MQTKAELTQWVHDKASMNNSLKTAEEIVDAVLSFGKKDEHVPLVLTVYECGCEEPVGFHAGPEGDFERDVESHKNDVIKKFWIRGEIIREGGR